MRKYAIAGVLAVIWGACTPPKSDNPTSDDSGAVQSEPDNNPDEDGDGVLATVDCDDTDPDRGTAPTWYADGDGDGHGDARFTEVSCDPPEDHVLLNDDCDDGDAAVWPGAPEVPYDGVDQDCDGADLVDVDGDGVPAMEAGGADCADDDPTVPGPSEVLGNQTDDDCDGLTDGAPIPSGAWEGEADGDNAGYSVALGSDVTGDGLPDFLVGASHHATPGSSAGKVYVIPGRTAAGGGNLSTLTTTIESDAGGAQLGKGAWSPGDLDGDGFGELVVGADHSSVGVRDAGAVFVFSGPVTATRSTASADAVFTGHSQYDFLGLTLSLVEHDSDAFLVLGTGYAEPSPFTSENGVVAAFDASTSGSQTLADAEHRIYGDEPGDFFGRWLDHGDVNGDGVDDLIVGAEEEAPYGRLLAGGVYVILGPIANLDDLAYASDVASAHWVGDSAGDHVGRRLAVVGDMDGDGAPEVAVPAYHADCNGENAGAVYLVGDAAEVGEASLADLAPATCGSGEGAHFGVAVAAGGDVDGDGAADVWISSDNADTPDSDAGGTVTLLMEAPAGSWTVDALTEPDAPVRGLWLWGDAAETNFGVALSGGVDVDQDGVLDLALGSNAFSSGGAGSAQVVSGASLW